MGEVGGGRVEKVVAVGRDGDGGSVGEEEREGRVWEEFGPSWGKLVSVQEKEAERRPDNLGTDLELGRCRLGQRRVGGRNHNRRRHHPPLLPRVGRQRHADFRHPLFGEMSCRRIISNGAISNHVSEGELYAHVCAVLAQCGQGGDQGRDRGGEGGRKEGKKEGRKAERMVAPWLHGLVGSVHGCHHGCHDHAMMVA